MAVSKVILNGDTLMDVTVDTVTSDKLLTGYQATGRDGQKVQGAYAPIALTSGSADPSEVSQHITPPSGYGGFEYFDVSAVSSDYVGSNIARHSAADLSVSGSVVSVPSGYYAVGANTAIASASYFDAIFMSPNPTITVSSTGNIVSTVSNYMNSELIITPGYISSIKCESYVEGSASYQLSTQAATTYTPSSTTQTIPSGVYLTGVQTVKGDENFVAANIASGVTIFGVLGTHQGGTDTDDATLNNSNQMLNGVTAYAKGSKYTGNIPTRSSANVTVSGSAVSVQSGYYASAVSTNIAEGSVQVHSLSLNRTPNISFNSVTGILTATQPNGSTGIGATVTTGYITQNDVSTGSVTVSGSSSYKLDTQAAATITPTESSQTAVASGKFTTGNVTVAAIPSDYIGSAIASVSVVEGTTTVSGTTATRGDATWSAGIIAAGNMGAATFANSSSGQTQYVDISNTTEAPVLVSGGYLYINKGYTDDLKISLAKLVPDGASANLASSVILSGYAAYDNDGNLVAGNIPTKSSANVSASGSTVTVPSGYYATQVAKNVAAGSISISDVDFTMTPIWSISNTGLIWLQNQVGGWRTPTLSSGYISTVPSFHVGASLNTTYQLDTQVAATINPTELSQTAVASHKYTTGAVTVAAIPSTYVGSGVATHVASDITVSGPTVSVPSGYYASAVSTTIPNGSVTPRGKSWTPAVGTISLNSSTGLISVDRETSNSTFRVTTSSGYIEALETTGNLIFNAASTTYQLDTQAAATIIPIESSQTAVAAGKYTTGAVTVAAISSNYIGSNIPTRTASNVSASGSTVTIPQGYYASQVTKNVDAGEAYGGMGIGVVPSITVSSTGKITSAVDTSLNTELIITPGYFSAIDFTGYAIGSSTYQLSTQAATTINPTESEQTAVAAGKFTTGAVKVGAISSSYIGSAIATHSVADVTVSGPTVSIPSGYYSSSVDKTVALGSAHVQNTNLTRNPTIALNSSSGTITAELYYYQTGVGAYLNPGYVTSITNGNVGVNGSASYQLDTVAAATITPIESSQVAVASGKYTLGPVTIAAISSNYVGSNIPTRSSSDLSASGSIVTVPSGYYVSAVSTKIKQADFYEGMIMDDLRPSIVVSNTGLITTEFSATYTDDFVRTPGYASQAIMTFSASGSSSYQLSTHSAADVVISGPTVSIPSGYYASAVNTTIPSGTLQGIITMPAVNPNWSVDSATGVVSVMQMVAPGIQPVETSGYLDTNEYIYPVISLDSSYQLTTQSATTYTPSSSTQTINAGQYLTGVQTIKGDVNLIAENIAAGVSIFGINGTHSGGIDTSDATLNSSSQMLSGVTAYASGIKYTGDIPTKSSSDLSISGAIVTVPLGYYSTDASISFSIYDGSVT